MTKLRYQGFRPNVLHPSNRFEALPGMTQFHAKIVEMAINGFSNGEIAEEMDTTDSTVKVLLCRARARPFNVPVPKGHRGRKAEPKRRNRASAT